MNIVCVPLNDPVKVVRFAEYFPSLVASFPKEFGPFAEKLRQLIEYLDNDGPSETDFACCFEGMIAPHVTLSRNKIARIVVTADYFDRALATGRQTGLHYRLSIQREGSTLTRDYRCND